MTARFSGLPVSAGVSVGEIYLGDGPEGGVAAGEDAVRAAFVAVASERSAFAARLRARGEDTQAGIVEIGALIAADPALTGPALDAVRAGTDAVTAVTAAAQAQADVLAALPDPSLSERAGDVRQVAAAVLAELRRTAGEATPPAPPDRPFILVRRDVDPAELIRLADSGARLTGAVSVGGGASSHAAIVARGLGLPMLARADAGVLDSRSGHPAILDANAGLLIVDPATTAAIPAQAVHSPAAGGFVTTRDGERITLLCNVASAAETRLGLSAGAAGVGLLRTEIPFIGSRGWPSEEDLIRQLEPILRELAGRPAVVRLLDFSGDKIPPFLHNGGKTGLSALLSAPGALDAQLRAITRTAEAARAELAVLVPMVSAPDEVGQVRERLATAAAAAGLGTVPELGIMVEVAATAANAAEFAKSADFFSIGTNDLASEVLGFDRTDPRGGPSSAADPRVLDLIATTVQAAGQAGIKVSVCGDAAADPRVLPRLLALGVRVLSVGAASVPRVAGMIAAADTTGTTSAAS
ncbi:MAG TPA: putative PEP-binding protein [Streptosporangiaceae bacterium]|nr:putative PEP-binding protein [Streptosporangiaceae bacterium]